MDPSALQAALAGRKQFIDETSSISSVGIGTGVAAARWKRETFTDKSDTGFVGLINQGATCYLNSLLQMLFMMPELRRAVFEWHHPNERADAVESDTDNDVEPEGELDDNARSLPLQLQRLFAQMQLSLRGAVSTAPLTKSFGWGFSEASVQHDIEECLYELFDALHRACPGAALDELLQRVPLSPLPSDRTDTPTYGTDSYCNGSQRALVGEWLSYTLPPASTDSSAAEPAPEPAPAPARVTREKEEPLLVVNLQCRGVSSVEEALRRYVTPDELSGDNQYEATVGNGGEEQTVKVDALKGSRFIALPQYLKLKLQRFDMDWNTMQRVKLDDQVRFPTVLDMSPYMHMRLESSTTQTQTQDAKVSEFGGTSPLEYDLFALLVHSGSAHAGHYVAYVRDFESSSPGHPRWLRFNDAKVTDVATDELERLFGEAVEAGDAGVPKAVRPLGSAAATWYMAVYRRKHKGAAQPRSHSDAPPPPPLPAKPRPESACEERARAAGMRPATMKWVHRDNQEYAEAKRKHDAEARMVQVRVYPWHTCSPARVALAEGDATEGGSGAGSRVRFSTAQAGADARVLRVDRGARLRVLVEEAWRALHGAGESQSQNQNHHATETAATACSDADSAGVTAAAAPRKGSVKALAARFEAKTTGPPKQAQSLVPVPLRAVRLRWFDTLRGRPLGALPWWEGRQESVDADADTDADADATRANEQHPDGPTLEHLGIATHRPLVLEVAQRRGQDNEASVSADVTDRTDDWEPFVDDMGVTSGEGDHGAGFSLRLAHLSQDRAAKALEEEAVVAPSAPHIVSVRGCGGKAPTVGDLRGAAAREAGFSGGAACCRLLVQNEATGGVEVLHDDAMPLCSSLYGTGSGGHAHDVHASLQQGDLVYAEETSRTTSGEGEAEFDGRRIAKHKAGAAMAAAMAARMGAGGASSISTTTASAGEDHMSAINSPLGRLLQDMAATISIAIRLVAGDDGSVHSGDDSTPRSVDINIGTKSSLEQLRQAVAAAAGIEEAQLVLYKRCADSAARTGTGADAGATRGRMELKAGAGIEEGNLLEQGFQDGDVLWAERGSPLRQGQVRVQLLLQVGASITTFRDHVSSSQSVDDGDDDAAARGADKAANSEAMIPGAPPTLPALGSIILDEDRSVADAKAQVAAMPAVADAMRRAASERGWEECGLRLRGRSTCCTRLTWALEDALPLGRAAAVAADGGGVGASARRAALLGQPAGDATESKSTPTPKSAPTSMVAGKEPRVLWDGSEVVVQVVDGSDAEVREDTLLLVAIRWHPRDGILGQEQGRDVRELCLQRSSTVTQLKRTLCAAMQAPTTDKATSVDAEAGGNTGAHAGVTLAKPWAWQLRDAASLNMVDWSERGLNASCQLTGAPWRLGSGAIVLFADSAELRLRLEQDKSVACKGTSNSEQAAHGGMFGTAGQERGIKIMLAEVQASAKAKSADS